MPDETPVVSAFPGSKPAKMKSAVVWGNDLRTVNAASVWLQRQGILVYSQAILQSALAKNAARNNLLLIDDGAVLDAARQVEAESVVFADRVGDSRPPMVSVRAIDSDSGRILWSGNARSSSEVQLPSNETLTWLTDQALDGAFGIKPKEE
jgi:hypothetical protein